MQIAVTGEGHTDYGQRDYITKEWKDGPIQCYMREIAKKVTEEPIEFHVFEKEDVRRVKVQQRSLQGLVGQGIPAKKFAILMKNNDLQDGVFYCDADKESGTKNTRNEAKKRFLERYQEIKQGLEDVNAIPMVPLRMIESWLLGDKIALELATNVQISSEEMPNSPEFLWGAKDNPNSNYPKHYLARLIKRQANWELFSDIAENADVNTMIENCPISYGKFYEDFTNLLGCKH